MPKRKEQGETGGTKKPRRTRRVKGVKQAAALSAAEVQAGAPPAEVAGLEEAIRQDGGTVLAVYREPFGGTWLLQAVLPIEQVAPTPYQRDLSDTHMGKLMGIISKIGRFLDPIVAVREGERQYWTPNGHHRLVAMKNLGARAIPALIIPQRSAAYQILALNTEKAHNLRERALEVVRMYRELAQLDEKSEEDYSLEFEEPALLTLGLCYEGRPRFSGGAYHPMIRRVDQFLKGPLKGAIEEREKLAKRLLEIDDLVIEKVKQLKARGMESPYLKTFVVARINPVRFRPKGSTLPSLPDTLEKSMASLQKLDPSRIRTEDLARTGGPPEAAE